MAQVLDLFDRLYVINLPERTDRRREMAAQLQLVGLDFDHAQVTLFAATRPRDAGGFPSLGARGCFESHLGVLEDALQRGHRRILLLEDDLNFNTDFRPRWAALLPTLQTTDWQLLYGDHRCDGALQPVTEGLASATAGTAIGTTDFVAFQGDAVAIAARELRSIALRPPGDPVGGPMHVDGAYNVIRRQHAQWLTLLATPALGHQRASRTDIHALRWWDTTTGFKQATALWRRVRNG